MAGLDKILEGIRSESAKAVDSVMNKAKAEYDAQMEDARKEAGSQAQKILARAKAQADDLIARADSAAALEERRMLLGAKQEIISDVISTPFSSDQRAATFSRSASSLRAVAIRASQLSQSRPQ
jgi:V/A-type H+-transporting ATPase subunit E